MYRTVDGNFVCEKLISEIFGLKSPMDGGLSFQSRRYSTHLIPQLQNGPSTTATVSFYLFRFGRLYLSCLPRKRIDLRMKTSALLLCLSSLLLMKTTDARIRGGSDENDENEDGSRRRRLFMTSIGMGGGFGSVMVGMANTEGMGTLPPSLSSGRTDDDMNPLITTPRETPSPFSTTGTVSTGGQNSQREYSDDHLCLMVPTDC